MTYEIGYRRPPPSGRFKKGSSGNPNGRPKGSRNFLTVLERELEETVVVNENGKKKRMTRMQAMVKRLVNGALQGDQRALLTLFEVLRRTSRLESTDVDDLLPENYEAILDAYVETRRKSGANKPQPTNLKGERS